MRPILVRLLLLVWILLWLSPAHGADQPDENLAFAEHLFAQRDFYRAITEYQRYLFQHPDSPKTSWLRFRIGQSYLRGGKALAAHGAFADLEQDATDERIRQWAILGQARAFLLQGLTLQAADRLLDLQERELPPHMAGLSRYLLGSAHARNGSFAQAQTAFASLHPDHALSLQANKLSARLGEVDLPHKSPAAAGLLSIVPGLGHMYLQEYTVALTAAVWNGLFAYAAYDTLRSRQWGAGILLAALELFWYSGTIYGAVSGAQRFNRDARLNFIEELENQAPLDLPFPDGGSLASIFFSTNF